MKKRFWELLKIFKYFCFFSILINLSSIALSNSFFSEAINPSCKTFTSESSNNDLRIFDKIKINYNESKLRKKIGIKRDELKASGSNQFYLSGQLKKKI